MKKKKVTTGIRISKELNEKLDCIAEYLGYTKNTVISQACWEMINKWEENKQANK